jgi:hypothetical protein
MKHTPLRRSFSAFALALLVPYEAALAVYAPIPEQEQGKAFTVSVRTAASYDSNIFGSATDEMDSNVYTLSAKASFNASLTEQTFTSAFYQGTLDSFEKRPGERNLYSHDFFVRLAHSFSPATTADLFNFFNISKNPESLLNGIALGTDQSFKRNQFDARFTTTVTERTEVTLKYRNTLYRFDQATLAQNLDRMENLLGLVGSYAVLPETKAVFEYRRQIIAYRFSGSTKNKQSDYVLGGADYKMGEKLTASARLGYEWRHRDSEASASSPSAEVSLKYDYAAQSYIAAGYSLSIEEASNTAAFSDTKVNRIFANIQHVVAPG